MILYYCHHYCEILCLRNYWIILLSWRDSQKAFTQYPSSEIRQEFWRSIYAQLNEKSIRNKTHKKYVHSCKLPLSNFQSFLNSNTTIFHAYPKGLTILIKARQRMQKIAICRINHLIPIISAYSLSKRASDHKNGTFQTLYNFQMMIILYYIILSS